MTNPTEPGPDAVSVETNLDVCPTCGSPKQIVSEDYIHFKCGLTFNKRYAEFTSACMASFLKSMTETPADQWDKVVSAHDVPAAKLRERLQKAERENERLKVSLSDADARIATFERELAEAQKKLEQWPIKWAATMDSYDNLWREAERERDHARAKAASLRTQLADTKRKYNEEVDQFNLGCECVEKGMSESGAASELSTYLALNDQPDYDSFDIGCCWEKYGRGRKGKDADTEIVELKAQQANEDARWHTLADGYAGAMRELAEANRKLGYLSSLCKETIFHSVSDCVAEKRTDDCEMCIALSALEPQPAAPRPEAEGER